MTGLTSASNWQPDHTGLVLHYTHTNTTWECGRLFIGGGSDPTFEIIRKILPELDWERTCVFNYIQRVLEHGHYSELVPECYFESESGFRSNIDTHKPRKLLVLGAHGQQARLRGNKYFKGSAAIAREQLRLHYPDNGILIETAVHPTYPHNNPKLLKEQFIRYRAAWESLNK